MAKVYKKYKIKIYIIHKKIMRKVLSKNLIIRKKGGGMDGNKNGIDTEKSPWRKMNW